MSDRQTSIKITTKEDDNDIVTEVFELAVLVLTFIKPEVGFSIGTVFSSAKILHLLNEKVFARNKEAKEYIVKADLEKFLDDEESRDKILTLLQRLWEEPNKAKRLLYYGYLNNLGSKEQEMIDFTRLMSTIANLDIEDIKLLVKLDDKYPEILRQQLISNSNRHNIKEITDDMLEQKRLSGVFTDRIYSYFNDPAGEDPVYLENSLNALSNYGTIFVQYGKYDGTTYGPVTQLGKEVIKYFEETNLIKE